ncbi:helix-turn-helix transcriptional regulator [Kitasatospora sp. NA04385]|uniref:helix-turn-helix domain-containing protein n=1 Tax=Kitasatospora sp. NA04385 TaxID=2742135 RepID=UPI001591960D|nr:helix-turn-helix transcriptional regulator [Kitasatospora sp. NA04385]QKW18851.1 helix-turn-helix transcriptional regulator [Kitasatospora sp. NA04385]
MNKRELDPEASPADGIGALLRTSREQREWTQEHLASLVGCTSSYISAVEHGRRKPSQQVATALDRAFGSGEQFVRGRSTASQHALFEGFPELVRNEAKATAIRVFEVSIIPSLLRTHDYERAYQAGPVLRGVATQEQADERSEALFQRQRALERTPAPFYHAVIDEAALRRPVGGLDVMVTQLRHLEAVAARPRFRIQVTPFSLPEARSFALPVVLLTMPNRSVIGYGETQKRGYLERDLETLEEWLVEYDYLQGEALSQAASIEFIRGVRRGFEHGRAA